METQEIKVKPHKWTEEEDRWIRENCKGIKRKELAIKFNEHFGLNLKVDTVICYMKNHHYTNGLDCRFPKGWATHNKGKHMSPEQYEKCKATMFKKGQPGINHRPVGSERFDKDFYLMIKVAEPSKWMLKHRWVWEQHYGPIPKGMKVTFKDGDKYNLDIDNLMLCTRGENAVANKHGLNLDGCRETAILTARLMIETNKRSRKNGNSKEL